MIKIIFPIMFLLLSCTFAFGQDVEQVERADETSDGIVPLSLLFYNIGHNALHSVTYNYGLNFAASGLETWALIETGVDWKWRSIAYENERLSNAGVPGFYLGFAVPAVAPVAAYVAGRLKADEKLQITGLALAQSLAITLCFQTAMKVSTGRAKPDLVTELTHTRRPHDDDFSGKFDMFNMNFTAGWPSGHTATAFMSAAVVSEIYHDNIWLKAGVYAYAALIGFGQSVTVHWASDIVAGALIGEAVGRTVGKSYRKLLEKDKHAMDDNKITLYASCNALGLIIRI